MGVGERFFEVNIGRSMIPKELTEYVKNLEKNVGEGRGLLILGPTGTGKTSSLVVIMKHILKKYGCILGSDLGLRILKTDCEMIFASSNQVFNSIFNREFDFINDCRLVEILMIDDFGREYFHDFPFSEFEDMIDYRYSHKLSTFVTSNLTPKALREIKAYRRVVDRWIQTNDIIQISGPSMRKQQC